MSLLVSPCGVLVALVELPSSLLMTNPTLIDRPSAVTHAEAYGGLLGEILLLDTLSKISVGFSLRPALLVRSAISLKPVG